MNAFLRLFTANFQLDVRSLALFRVTLGLVLLGDWITRVGDLSAHYTDLGVVPLEAYQNFSRHGIWDWSIHALSGDWTWQVVLFGVHLLLILCFIIGFKTRLVNLLLFIILLSLHNRNPMVLNAGDRLIRCMLFFALFAPLGARWSIDVVFSSKALYKLKVVGGAIGALFILQLSYMYFFSAVLKTGKSWADGTAIYYSLNIASYAKSTASYILAYPDLLKIMSYYVYYLELLGFLLFFIPWKQAFFRGLVCLLFISFHLGLFVFMELGMFPWVAIACWTAVFPSAWWDFLFKKKTEKMAWKYVYFPENDSKTLTALRFATVFFLCKRIVFVKSEHKYWALGSNENSADTQEVWNELLSNSVFPFLAKNTEGFLGKIVRWRSIFSARFFSILNFNKKYNDFSFWNTKISVYISAFFVLIITMSNIDRAKWTAPMPSFLAFFHQVPRITQFWGVFKSPSNSDGWYIIILQLKNGETVNIRRDDLEVTLERPEVVSATYPNHRWRKYMRNLHTKKNRLYLPYFAKYAINDWNAKQSAPEKMAVRLDFYFANEFTEPQGNKKKFREIVLMQYVLSAEGKPAEVIFNELYYDRKSLEKQKGDISDDDN